MGEGEEKVGVIECGKHPDSREKEEKLGQYHRNNTELYKKFVHIWAIKGNYLLNCHFSLSLSLLRWRDKRLWERARERVREREMREVVSDH